MTTYFLVATNSVNANQRVQLVGKLRTVLECDVVEVDISPPVAGLATTSNQGVGSGLALPVAGSDAPFRSLVAGTGVAIVQNPTNLTISSPPDGVQSVSNDGAGSQVSKALVGSNAPFRSLVAGTGMSLVQNTNDITLNCTVSGGLATTSNDGAGSQLAKPLVGSNAPFRSLVAGSGIAIVQNTNDLTISSPESQLFGLSSFQISLGQSSAALFSGTNASANGNLQGHLVYAQSNITVNSMTCWSTNGGGTGGAALRMGIYSQAGAKLGETSSLVAPFATGLLTVPMLAPVNLVRGTAYFLALWCNANALSFLQVAGGWAGAGPIIAPQNVNVLIMPATLNVTSPQANRYFLAATA